MKGHEARKGTERDGTWHVLSKRQVVVIVVIMVVVIVVETAAVAVVMVLYQMCLLGAPFPLASLAVPSHSSLLLPDHLSASSYWLGTGVWAQGSVHFLFSPCTHTFTSLLISHSAGKSRKGNPSMSPEWSSGHLLSPKSVVRWLGKAEGDRGHSVPGEGWLAPEPKTRGY